MFEPIQKDITYFFGGCEGCVECCKYPFIPLVIDDFKDVYKLFPILFTYINNELRAVILLGDKDGCRYLSSSGCAIYEFRPPSCRLYPITPFFDDIFIDTSCLAVGKVGEIIAQNGKACSAYRHERLNNFSQKLRDSQKFLSAISGMLVPIGERKGFLMFAVDADMDGEYGYLLRLHAESLKFL